MSYNFEVKHWPPIPPSKSERKYIFTRKNWYEFSYVKIEDVHGFVKWCEDNFGPEDEVIDPWKTRWWLEGWTLMLKDEQDYMLTILRWA